MSGRWDATVITFDIDWAPDFVIDAVAARLAAARARSTWFVTHASPAVDRLRGLGPLVELGAHPNFLPRSTHGASIDDVLRHIAACAPEATSVRTHGLLQSGEIMEAIMRRTSYRVVSNEFLP